MATVESLPPASGSPRPSALAQMVIGLGICFAAAAALFPACGGQQLAPLIRCKVEAVGKVLPEDPNQITVGDLRDIVGRFNACHAADAARDAGR